LIYWNC